MGSDAGFIYQLYGFTTIREMGMQQEAGFRPLEVIQHATSNGAKLLGLTNTGVVRPGFKADLIVVDGNPLHNMKVLYATGLQVEENGKLVQRGGVKYTIKDGVECSTWLRYSRTSAGDGAGGTRDSDHRAGDARNPGARLALPGFDA